MISDKDLANLCRALADTARSGLSVNDAFATLSKSKKYGKFIAKAAQMTAGGKPIHEALQAQKIFPSVFVALMRAGEEGGKIDEFLNLFADYIEVRIKFKRRLALSLVYPVFAFILALILILVFLFKIFPLIMESLLMSGIAIPPQMIWMDSIAWHLRAAWPRLALSIFIIIAIFAILVRSGLWRKIKALAGHLIPGFKFAFEDAFFHAVYTTMGLLLKAGIPLGSLMDILLDFLRDDIVYRRHFSRAAAMLSKGGSFSESLFVYMPAEDKTRLEIAEKAGSMGDTLVKLGKIHFERHSHKLKLIVISFKISSFIAIGLVTFALIIAIISPALSLIKQARIPMLPDSKISSNEKPVLKKTGFSELRRQTIENKTAIFNKEQGGKIADIMEQSARKSSLNLIGVPQSEDSQNGIKKLAPVRPMQKTRFQKIEPTQIEPTKID